MIDLRKKSIINNIPKGRVLMSPQYDPEAPYSTPVTEIRLDMKKGIDTMWSEDVILVSSCT